MAPSSARSAELLGAVVAIKALYLLEAMSYVRGGASGGMELARLEMTEPG